MGRPYAAVLGTVALCVVVLRGVLHHATIRDTIPAALAALLAFSALGALLGWLADRLVRDTLRGSAQATAASPADRRTSGVERREGPQPTT